MQLRWAFVRPPHQEHGEQLLSPVEKSQSKIADDEGHTYQGHLVRHGDDYGVSLICSIQHMSRSMGAGLTLTAQANARPIPSTMSSTQRVPLDEENCTSISGRGLYDNAMAGDKLAFLLSGLHHSLRDAILHGTTD